MIRTVLAFGLCLALAGCSAGQPNTPSGASGRPVAVATTTELGSVVSDIATCAGSTSATLMAPGVDPHDFSLSSSAVADMTRGALVIANGLGLEGGMKTALDNVKADGGRVYEVAPDLSPQPLDEPGQAGLDPHVWMDVKRMAKAASLIGAQLKQSTGNDKFASCGDQVAKKLADVDDEVRTILSAVPQDKRILVTDHDACGYFASAYGFKIAGVVIPGGSTDAASSSADMKKVIEAVKSSGVHAIFSNTAVSPKLVETVAAEAGGVRVVPLYVDSVGAPGSGADTYAAMMKANAHAIADALK